MVLVTLAKLKQEREFLALYLANYHLFTGVDELHCFFWLDLMSEPALNDFNGGTAHAVYRSI